MQNKRDKYDRILLGLSCSNYISKNIFQTYRTKVVPIEIEQNINKVKNNNPSWNYQLFDDDEIVLYIRENYGEKILSYYNKINPEYGAARADFFRYLLIYKEGGIYLDLKSNIESSLDLHIGTKYILSHWDNSSGEEHEGWGKYAEVDNEKGEFVQWFIISPAGHPFLREVILTMLERIDTYNPLKHGTGIIGTLRTTGPIMYSHAINSIIHKYDNLFEIRNYKELGLKYSIYDKWEHKTAIKTKYDKYSIPLIRHLNPMVMILFYLKRLAKSFIQNR